MNKPQIRRKVLHALIDILETSEFAETVLREDDNDTQIFASEADFRRCETVVADLIDEFIRRACPRAEALGVGPQGDGP